MQLPATYLRTTNHQNKYRAAFLNIIHASNNIHTYLYAEMQEVYKEVLSEDSLYVKLSMVAYTLEIISAQRSAKDTKNRKGSPNYKVESEEEFFT